MNMDRSFREEDYFSTGFQNLISVLCSHKSEVRFPYGCCDTRISSQQTLHEWFVDLVDNRLHGRVKDCAVEENMGVFAHLKYKDNLIAYANIQVVITENDLEALYLDSTTHCRSPLLFRKAFRTIDGPVPRG
jgi:hypothetical protein